MASYAHDPTLYASRLPDNPIQEILATHKPAGIDGANSDESLPQTISVAGKKYRVMGMLGRGGFGQVYRVIGKEFHKRSLALKKVEAKHRNGIPFLMEASIMASYSHPNLVTAQRVECGKNKLYIFLDEAVANLNTWRRHISPTHNTVRTIFYSLLRALEFLHSESIIHADVKDDNVLVYGSGTEPGDFRLGDCSLSYLKSWPKRHLPCTKDHRPLEGWGNDWDERVDIFALGCTMYRVIFDYKLFVVQSKNKDDRHKAERHINALLDWEDYFARHVTGVELPATTKREPIAYHEPRIHPRLDTKDDIVALVLSALHPHGSARPSAQSLLQSPMFSDLTPPQITSARPIIRFPHSGWASELGKYTSDPHTIELASRIKARYLTTDPNPMPEPALLDTTVVWMATKIFKHDSRVGPDPRIIELECDICRATNFILH